MKVNPKYPEEAHIVWTLPNQENFALYKEGKMFADPLVNECIEKYLKDPRTLMLPEPGMDLPEKKMKELWISYLKRLKVDKQKLKNKVTNILSV